MKILITGGTGLIGSRLVELLGPDLNINILTRSPRLSDGNVHYYKWDPKSKSMDERALDDVDAIINLAGAGIADKRWTDDRKKVILDSRIDSASTIAKYLKERSVKPSIYIGASAVGYYGDQGEKRLTEMDEPGDGFLAEVTEKWEIAHELITSIIERSMILRIGIVLSTKGGALKEILKPSALGAYGYFGNGQAYYSWVHIDDICGMIIAALEDDKYDGIYNGSAPEPLTNKDLVKATKKGKNGIGLVMPVPTLALKIAMGEMTQMLTNSTRVIPQKLLDEKHPFKYTDAAIAIRDLLARKI